MLKKVFLFFLLPFLFLIIQGCETSSDDNSENRPKPSVILKADGHDGIAPFAVNFDASYSKANGGTIVSYEFNFGDGTPHVVATTPFVSHIYERRGDFMASVRVTNSEGQSNLDGVEIRVIEPGTGDIEIGTPALGGSGCPFISASAILTPDRKGLSVLFDEMVAEAGNGGDSISRKSCSLAIPVKVPDGVSVSVFKIDYRGFASAPVGGKAQFNVEYFFAGVPGPTFTKTFEGPHDGNFFLSNDLAATTTTWSDCGGEVILRVKTDISATTNQNHDPVLASLDSLDALAGVTYHFSLQNCSPAHWGEPRPDDGVGDKF